MKLNLLFIVLDLLTLLAYPIVYLDGILRQFSKPFDDRKRFYKPVGQPEKVISAA